MDMMTQANSMSVCWTSYVNGEPQLTSIIDVELGSMFRRATVDLAYVDVAASARLTKSNSNVHYKLSSAVTETQEQNTASTSISRIRRFAVI